MKNEGKPEEEILNESDEIKKEQNKGSWKESKYSPEDLKKAQDKVNKKQAGVENS